MQKILNNQKGASLLEIVATITITSIALLMIYNILSFNIRQNGVNQEKMINSTIANSALSYIINQNFDTINNYLGDSNYALIDENSCNSVFSSDIETCMAVFKPMINNKQYNADNLYIYIMPYNDPFKLSDLKSTPPQARDIFLDYLNSIDTEQMDPTNINDNAISVIVIVESSINDRYDYLLRGITTNDTK